MPSAIGEYEVLSQLVHSQTVELFRARKPGEPIVCIKRLPPNVCDVDVVARFDHEMKISVQLRHRNIVTVYEHGEDDGHYFVMELIDGMDLGALIREVGPLDPELVAYVGAEIARAFVYLHHSDSRRDPPGPLVHCDLSPENVLIDSRGRVKLSDFGMARVLLKTGAETITSPRGKLSYLSPEQWRGDKLTTRSDLFSFGVVLWTALIRSHPYAEGRPRGRPMHDWIGQRTKANLRRSVAEAAPRAPRALQRAIQRLLQPVGKRTPTAEAFLKQVEALVPQDGAARLAALIPRQRMR